MILRQIRRLAKNYLAPLIKLERIVQLLLSLATRRPFCVTPRLKEISVFLATKIEETAQVFKNPEYLNFGTNFKLRISYILGRMEYL